MRSMRRTPQVSCAQRELLSLIAEVDRRDVWPDRYRTGPSPGDAIAYEASRSLTA